MTEQIDRLGPLAQASSIHRSLAEALRAIPTGKRGALLIDATHAGHASARIATRIGAHWSAGVASTWDGHRVSGNVVVIGVW